MICNSERSTFIHKMNIRCLYICIFRKTVCLNFTGMTLKYLFKMAVIRIEDTLFALSEKQALTVDIIIKVLMFIWSDVVRLKICKYSVIKYKAAYSV